MDNIPQSMVFNLHPRFNHPGTITQSVPDHDTYLDSLRREMGSVAKALIQAHQAGDHQDVKGWHNDLKNLKQEYHLAKAAGGVGAIPSQPMQ